MRQAELREEARAAKRAAERRVAEEAPGGCRAPPSPIPPQLEAIAACESGGDPTAVSADGMYHGKYQFSVATWQAMGGSGLPVAGARGRAGHARGDALRAVRPGPVARLRRLAAADLGARHDVVLACVRPADPGLVAAVVVGRP